MARGKKKAPKDEIVVPENDGSFERDWVNDPMWLRDVLHRVFLVLPKDLDAIVNKKNAEECAAVLSDVEYIFKEEEERGYVVPSDDEDEGPDDEDDEEDDEDDDDGDPDEDDDDAD